MSTFSVGLQEQIAKVVKIFGSLPFHVRLGACEEPAAEVVVGEWKFVFIHDKEQDGFLCFSEDPWQQVTETANLNAADRTGSVVPPFEELFEHVLRGVLAAQDGECSLCGTNCTCVEKARTLVGPVSGRFPVELEKEQKQAKCLSYGFVKKYPCIVLLKEKWLIGIIQGRHGGGEGCMGLFGSMKFVASPLGEDEDEQRGGMEAGLREWFWKWRRRKWLPFVKRRTIFEVKVKPEQEENLWDGVALECIRLLSNKPSPCRICGRNLGPVCSMCMEELRTGKIFRARPSPEGIKRISRELQRLQQKTKADFIDCVHLLEDDITRWRVELRGFADHLQNELIQYAHCTGRSPSIVIEIQFGEEYPHQAPFVRIVSPLFVKGSSFVMENGVVCIDILSPAFWSPTFSLEAVLVSIHAILHEGEKARLEMREGEYNAVRAWKTWLAVQHGHGWIKAKEKIDV